MERPHLDFDNPLLIPVANEGMRVFRSTLFACDGDARPPELLDGHKGLVDVRVLGNEVRAKM
jgi:hypothetical protein